jgi:hypothetical protein
MEEKHFVSLHPKTQPSEARLLAQFLADRANLPRPVLHGVSVDHPATREMEHEMLAMRLDPGQQRTTNLLRSFAPAWWDFDSRNALAHQLP